MTKARINILAVTYSFFFSVSVITLSLFTQLSFAQEPERLNKIIEALEEDRPAFANQEWRMIDMEHTPFSGERLQSELENMQRDADGRFSSTPIVRIPQDGDEDFKWAVKQVLDQGGFGIVLPHVDTKEEAVRFVKAMRYPPFRDSAQPEPRGERGFGPNGALRLWDMEANEYVRRADVWPLNPEGELFAVAMIESQEAVNNIAEILEAPISAILIVPVDLAIDLGLGPFPEGGAAHPDVAAAYASVLEACLAQNRVICGMADSQERLQQRLDEGWRFVMVF